MEAGVAVPVGNLGKLEPVFERSIRVLGAVRVRCLFQTGYALSVPALMFELIPKCNDVRRTQRSA